MSNGPELKNLIDKANETDKKKELFSEDDLKAFTDLVKDKESFAELTKGFENKVTIEEIKGITGIEETIKTYIKTKGGLSDIFDNKEYEDLTDNKDLYEVFVLGAILSKGEVKNANYKLLAKEYYASITESEEEEEKGEKIEGYYDETKSEMKPATITKIENTIKTEKGKNITEAKIEVSAGADLRTMPLERAKTDRSNKMNTIKTFKSKFTNESNQTEIDTIIKELSVENIETKITDTSKDSKTNTEQNGNRYLIAARMAEGLIKALNNLKLTPEPTLTLKIDRTKCTIGASNRNGDIETDRYIKMNVEMKLIASMTKQVKKGKDEYIEEDDEDEIPPVKKKTNNRKNGDPTNRYNEEDEIIPPIDSKDSKETKTESPRDKNNKEKEKTKENIKTIESAETLQIRQDIADHFTFQGKDISSQEVSDMSQDSKDKNSYKVSIKGFANFVVKYTTDNKIEIAEAGISKGLLKRNIKSNQSTTVDRISKDRKAIKKDVDISLNPAKSKEYINTKLKSITTGEQGAYEVKNDADITEKKINVYYKNPGIFKEKIAGTAREDKISLGLDDQYMINKKTQSDIPGQRQKIEGTEKDIQCNKNYKMDDNKQQVTYYAETSGNIKDPNIRIINNITKTTQEGNTYKLEGIFPMYSTEVQKKKTIDAYAEKVKLQYETPNTTSIEKAFAETAHIEKNTTTNKYEIKAQFTIPNKTQVLELTIPITYKEGSSDNKNMSEIIYDSKPTLSRNGEYNMIDSQGNIIIDGIVYDIKTASKKQNNMPNIIFSHNKEKTLEKAKERTKKYTIASNLFGTHNVQDNINNYQINAGFGNCEYGPLSVKERKRSDPITYYKDVYVGQVKDNGRIILQGTKVGTMYFDQQGKFLEYTSNDKYMTFGKQTEKVDIKDHTPIGVTQPLGRQDKNILLTNKFEKNTVHVDIIDTDETYGAKKTSVKDFVATQDKDKADNMDKYFYNTTEVQTEIAKGRRIVYEGLKPLSNANIDKKSVDFFQLIPEIHKNPNVVLGPDRKGVYAYKLIKENGKYPAQYIYSKIDQDKIVLCNQNGDVLQEQKIFLQASNDYYTLKADQNGKEFIILGNKKELQKMSPKLTIDTKKQDKVYTGDLNDERTCKYRATLGQDYNAYQFTNKEYISLDIEIQNKEIKGEDKIQNIDDFSLTPHDKEGFGSYRNFFKTEKQETLGIDESNYEEVFKKLFKEHEKDSKDLVKVRYKKDGKLYYAPMHAKVTKKGEKNEIDLEVSSGWEKAIKETEKRLENMVKSMSIFMEQDRADKPKGNEIRGWYLVKPTITALTEHFKDPKQEIKMYIRTNNKINNTYQEQEIIYNPNTNDLTPKTFTINQIDYDISLQLIDRQYTIVVKKKKLNKSGSTNTTTNPVSSVNNNINNNETTNNNNIQNIDKMKISTENPANQVQEKEIEFPIEKIQPKKTNQIDNATQAENIDFIEPTILDQPEIAQAEITDINKNEGINQETENKVQIVDTPKVENNATEKKEKIQIPIQQNTDNTNEKPSSGKESNNEVSSGFSVNNTTLKNIFTNNKLLDNVSFENMVNTVNGMKNEEAKKEIQDYLSLESIVLAQEYIGMNRHSQYEDNKATGKINENMLKRLAQPYLLQQGEKLRPHLSPDVRNAYQDFLDGTEKNNGKNYAIISKKNTTLYVFNSDNKLLSKHNILLGTRGDYPPILKQGGSVFTTPGGIYTIDARDNNTTRKDNTKYAGPGDYLQLRPRDWEYPKGDFSIGIHTYFGDRKKFLDDMNANKRISKGCINTDEQGSIYDNLEAEPNGSGSKVSIADE